MLSCNRSFPRKMVGNMGIGYTDSMGSPEHSELIVAYSSKDTVMVISGLSLYCDVLTCSEYLAQQ